MTREVGFVPLPHRGGQRAVNYASTDTRRFNTSTRGRPKMRPASGRPRPRDQGAGGSLHPRHVLLKKRVLPIEEYVEELRRPPLHKSELMPLFGVPLLPIAVPLDPGETEEHHEIRFVIWLQKKGIDIAELRLDANTERTQRISFAKLKAKMYAEGIRAPARGKRERNEYEDGEEAQEDEYEEGEECENEDDQRIVKQETLVFERKVEAPGYDERERVAKRPRQEEHAYLRQRVLTADDYRAEIEREFVGKPNEADRARQRRPGPAEIPVPLLPGETEAQYERRFLKHLAQSGQTLADLADDPGKERSIRMNFARMRVGGHSKNNRLPAYPVKSSRKPEEPKSRASSFDSTATQSVEVKTEPVPDKRDIPASKEAPRTAPDPLTFPQECKLRRPTRDAPTNQLQAYMSCGCRPCLLSSTSLLTAQVSQLEQELAALSSSFDSKRVMDLTNEADMSSTSSVTSSSSTHVRAADVPKMLHIVSLIKNRRQQQAESGSAASVEDPIEQQLLAQYDEINDRVVTNQRVLDHAAEQLQQTPFGHVQEAAPTQAENLELQGLIDEEMDHRNAALAMLLVYMWRQAPQDLEIRVQAAGSVNVPHIQRACHVKCAAIASDVAAKRELAGELTAQLDAVLNEPPPAVYDPESDMQRLTRLQELGSQLTRVESDMKALAASRRRELTTLVHFDAHVRELITALMDETAYSKSSISSPGA